MHRYILLVATLVMFAGCTSNSSKTFALISDVDTSTLVSLTEALEIAQGEVPDVSRVTCDL